VIYAVMQKVKPAATRFLICIENKGYRVSLEKRKIYVALPDTMAFKHGQVRVIDESGERVKIRVRPCVNASENNFLLGHPKRQSDTVGIGDTDCMKAFPVLH
jgi:hypothetical protein